MLLEDYHLIFIIISFIMLFISINYIFIEPYKEGVIAGALLCSINWVLCLINYMSFFAVGIIGYSSDGSVEVTTYSGMYAFFVLFYVMQWLNLILVLVCWYKWTVLVHTESENTSNIPP